MPIPATAKFFVPESAEEFDKLATDIAGRIFGNRFQRHGRSGQAQQGVDAYAMLNNGTVIGLQHKNTANLTRATIKEEIAEAEKFEPALTEYTIMTTDRRDATIQLEVRKITALRIASNNFPVKVLFWDDICEELSGHADLLAKYYPWGNLDSHTPRIGAERAHAWVQQVLNPWIDGLDGEVDLLKTGNLTFRWHNGKPEYVISIAEHALDRHVLEDFLPGEPKG